MLRHGFATGKLSLLSSGEWEDGPFLHLLTQWLGGDPTLAGAHLDRRSALLPDLSRFVSPQRHGPVKDDAELGT